MGFACRCVSPQLFKRGCEISLYLQRVSGITGHVLESIQVNTDLLPFSRSSAFRPLTRGISGFERSPAYGDSDSQTRLGRSENPSDSFLRKRPSVVAPPEGRSYGLPAACQRFARDRREALVFLGDLGP